MDLIFKNVRAKQITKGVFILFNDFDLLNDPEFKEDSVREEITSPLLKQLGYSASGENKIVRSRALVHPFVYIGTKKHKVNIIPDYLLEVEGKPRLILDAKAPSQDILKGKNVEQAFSYAIHPDVRASRYALCNGKRLTVFDINKRKAIANIPISQWSERWGEINSLLSPVALTKPELLNFKPDFGLYMYQLGCVIGQENHFTSVGLPTIAKIKNNLYTAIVNVKYGDDWLAASFDFDKTRYKQLLSILPRELSVKIKESLSMQPFNIDFGYDAPEVNIHALLGKTVISNENEDYCPLKVIRFS